MPIGFEPGAAQMQPYELQRAVEDAFVEAGALLDQQHGGQGTHTDITADSIAPNADIDALLVSAIRLMAGPILMEVDGNPNSTVGVLRTPEITATQHDYNPDGLATAVMLELTSDAERQITGFVTSRRRRWLGLVNRGNATIVLKHNTGSSTAYRIAVSGSGDYLLRSGGIAWLYYDPGAPNWRVEGNAVGIRSIQQGTIAITNGNSIGTATLATTLTDTSKCVIAHLGSNGGSGGNATDAYLDNLSTTGLRATRSGTADSIVVSYQITEYY